MNKKRLALSYIYIIFTILVIGWLLSTGIESGDIRELFSGMNYIWFAGGFASILMFWLMDAIIVYQIIPYICREKAGFAKCVRYGILGLYYGALTPFASGGQPMQVVYMRRDGMPVGKATAVVSVKLFVNLLSMCFSFIVYMGLRGSFFFNEYSAIFWIAVMGFLVNLFGVVFILIMLTNKTLAAGICRWVIRILRKIRIVRDEERAFSKIEKTIHDFSEASSYMAENKLRTAFSFVLSLMKLSFLFAVPYMIFRAFNLTGYSMVDLASLNTFMFLTVSFMPTPGTSFAAEGGFRLIYFRIFGNLTNLAIGTWRIITYYSILLVGAVLVVFDQIIGIRKSGRIKNKQNEVKE